MKKFLLLFFISGALYAQSSGAYLIPRQIYVGDPATLVYPLPASSQNENIILTAGPLDSNLLPQDPSIDFHRIILERRIMGSRLMIEFTAFAPGVHELPVIEIGGEYFSGLTVTVNSLIDGRSAPALSGSASVLAMPGTAIMLYGSMAALVLIIIFAVWLTFRGRTLINGLREKWKRYRLFISIRKTEKRLQKAAAKGIEKRKILDKLSDEFREFLSVLTGNNCRSMTAREFKHEFKDTEDALFLSDFFRTCDEKRFSGADINLQDINKLLDDLRFYLDKLENTKKDEQKGENAA